MNKNNLSYWFPKIKDCGIKVPETIITHVPEEIQKCFFMEPYDKCENKIIEWINENIKPLMVEHLYFMKNAVFSNKFNFQHCITRPTKIADDLIDINYTALCVGANGTEEVILRKIIDHDRQNTPTIYFGMPMRSEFRVFYDFEQRKVLYSVNYWDYDYCYSRLYEKTDKIIFDYMEDVIATRFIENQNFVEELVKKHMREIDLQGKWSIDILLDEQGTYWLIDMAVAENSAYWEPNRPARTV